MSECEHDFFTVQSEDSRCMNCGETESSIQSWQYVLRIAELKATIAEQRKLMQAVVGAKENYPNNIICGAEGELAKSIDAMAEYLEKK